MEQRAKRAPAVAACDFHSLYTKSDGTLWGMGANGSGQLGDGTTENSVFPIRVLEDESREIDFIGNAEKGVKLTVPKTLVVPKNREKGTKAVYIWKRNGVIINQIDANGAYVSTKTWTAMENGSYSVEIWYTPAGGTEERNSVPEMTNKVVRNFVYPKFSKAKGGNVPQITAYLTEDGYEGVNPVENDPEAINSVVRGEKLCLTVTLEAGTGEFIYRWYKNNTKTLVRETESRKLTDTLETDVFGAKADGYFVVVETKVRDRADKKGVKPLRTVKSAPFKPKVILPPEITKFVAKPASTKAGKNVSITTSAKGTAKLNYKWFKGEDSLDEVELSETKATLTLKKVTAADAGRYRVVVTNAAGEGYAVEAEARITVDGFASAAEAEAVAALQATALTAADADAAQSGAGVPPMESGMGGSPMLSDASQPSANARIPARQPAAILPSVAQNTGEPPVPLSTAPENAPLCLAPDALATGTIIRFDDGANGVVTLEIRSATEFVKYTAAADIADSAAAAPANGEYSYTRISGTTAILTYAIENPDGSISTGEILLEFADAAGGTFTAKTEAEDGVSGASGGDSANGELAAAVSKGRFELNPAE